MSNKTQRNKPTQRLETVCLHAGEQGNRKDTPVLPISQTATFVFKNFTEIEAFSAGGSDKLKYGRYGNPIQKALEAKLAKMEGAEGCLLFASGMNAITTAVLSLVRAGDHVIYTDCLYRNSTRFFAEILPQFGVASTCVPVNNIEFLRDSIRANTKLVFCEIPTSLFLRVPDLSKVVKCCKRGKRNVAVIVDSTSATPHALKPVAHGVDLVVHSLTKYLAGHDDLLAGCVCGSDKILARVCAYRDVLGGICDPHNTFLALRSLKTFCVRMERLNENAQAVANFLRAHPKVRKIFYPGLTSHPDHRVAERLLKGFGSVIYFELHGGKKATRRFIESLTLPMIGTNFGGVHTFVEPFSQLTFGTLTVAERTKLGVGENLIRFCVGLEHPADIIEDIGRALSK